ncbi:MAG TPA: hypothetical protein VND21_09185 [Planctomycetota bacterium]|nr:hypothetical protein [Planctomycetota bacterium]
MAKATAKADTARPAPTLQVGAILERTIRLWARHFGACAGATAVLYSPLVYAAWMRSEDIVVAAWAFWAGLIAVLFASAFLSAGVVRSLQGDRASFPGSFLVALKRLPALVWVAVLLVGMTFLSMLPGLLAMGFVAQSMALDLKDAEQATWLLLFTPLLLVLPVLALVQTAVVMPVATIEGRGGMSAVWRSHRLTKGNRWRVFVVFFALLMLHFLVQTGLYELLPDGPAGPWLLLGHTILVTTGLLAVASAVVYEDLRVAKDGTDPETLGRVFE